MKSKTLNLVEKSCGIWPFALAFLSLFPPIYTQSAVSVSMSFPWKCRLFLLYPLSKLNPILPFSYGILCWLHTAAHHLWVYVSHVSLTTFPPPDCKLQVGFVPTLFSCAVSGCDFILRNTCWRRDRSFQSLLVWISRISSGGQKNRTITLNLLFHSSFNNDDSPQGYTSSSAWLRG